MSAATTSFRLLAQFQDGLVDRRVGPVVPQVIQVVVKVNQVVVGPAFQQGRRDLLCFVPVFKGVTATQTAPSVEKKQQNKIIKAQWQQPATGCSEDEA